MPQTTIQQLLPNTVTPTTANTGVLSIEVMSGGAGYTTAPAVTVNGPSIGAVASALIFNGQVSSIVVQTQGTGCTTVPTVTIAPPVPVTAQWAADTAVAQGEVLQSGLHVYTVTVAGTTGSTAPAFTMGSALNGSATLTYSGTQATAGLVVLNNVITGVARAAAGYILAGRTFQTLSWRYRDVIARITVEATLDADPTDLNTSWTTILFTDLSTGDPQQGITDTNYYNAPGNWVWIRVRVENFVLGTIEYIKMSY